MPQPRESSCSDCERPPDECIDFLVATPIWNYVMADWLTTTLKIRTGLHDERVAPRAEGVGGVVCLACFDSRAQAKGIEYRDSLVVFGRGCWMGGSYDGLMPTNVP